ncbi:hypothetical protein EDB80DRAFT_699660 [Ilyonectria destructans]|nr:hypothetical protein EDB80DRAFT_699660 [Ilyonectria destructans]
MQPVIDATAAAFKSTYADTFRLVFYVMIPFGVTALVTACFARGINPQSSTTLDSSTSLSPRPLLRKVLGGRFCRVNMQAQAIHY